MTPVALALALSAALVALATAGPWLLRRAAPAFVRLPRLGIAAVVGGVVVWIGALLAIGPALAWAGAGPALLPVGAAAVCQRCLAAANPFSVVGAESSVPGLILLALPVAAALALALAVARRMRQRTRRSRAAADALLHGAQRRTLHGYDIAVVNAEHPFALTFPKRDGGIVLSSGALRVLDDAELVAVLAHEHAHLRQRHHLIAAVLDSTAASLRWVPLVAAAADAVPHYLEIAADAAARTTAGTPALVSALLKLGERAHPAAPRLTGAAALHAAGPERIRQLVAPAGGLAGAVPAVVIGACLSGLAVAGAIVHVPYLSAAITGCV